MGVTKKYRGYSHLFYGYILIYHFFLFYAMVKIEAITLKFLFTENEFVIILPYIFIIIFNKSLLHRRERINNNFGLFVIDSYFDPSKKEQAIGFVRSTIGNIVYISFNTMLISYLIRQFGNADSESILSLLRANYFVFPIALLVWDLKRIFYYKARNKEEIKKARQAHVNYAEKMQKNLERKEKSDNLGEMTGYEPRNLKEIELMPTPLMKGEPGAGLSGSSFSITNKKLGALGELNFAKVLQQNEYLKKFATYWSIQYPLENRPGIEQKNGADIDCVLLTKNNLYLIDLKLYTQGDVTWKTITSPTGETLIQAMDNITEDWVGKPLKMSQNMRFATERIQSKLKSVGVKMKVKPYVVMMPTDRGQGKVDNVFWPGKVECVTLTDFLKIIEADKPYNNQSDNTVVLDSIFSWLIKDESGQANQFNK